MPVKGKVSALSGEKASFMAESPCGETATVPPRWRSRSAEPVSRDRRATARQFRGIKPGFPRFVEGKRSAEFSRRLPCDPERSEAQWAGRCAWHRAVLPMENLPCFRILLLR